MDPLSLARWQFGITTVYHFLFVPLTIGLSFLVALMQTLHLRTRDGGYLRMTKFFGNLFLINIAMGVVTGIVQEFQFGMNWSSYSRFVGDVFGAPLAVEGLLAFFLESTFIGLWMFGWGRLPEKIHLACIWMVALGTNLSAYFILAANSWMQHPVGYQLNPVSGRAEMTDIGAILTNSTLLVTYPHTIAASLLTGALFVLAVSAYQLRRGREVQLFGRSAALGLAFALVASVGVVLTGDTQAKVMTSQQPMKMAAAEALYRTQNGAPLSLFAIGTLDGRRLLFNPHLPNLLSVLATNTLDGQVEGIDDIEARYQLQYGPGVYTPVIPVTYWSFRLMAGLGFVMAAFAAWGLLLLRRGRLATARRFQQLAMVAVLLPFAGNSLGWIFTEMGRQPWVVFGLMKTANGVSPSVSPWMVGCSMVGFTLIYGLLAAIESRLLLKYIRQGPGDESPEAELAPVMAY